MLDELLTLADATEYYQGGIEPWEHDDPPPPEDLTPEKLAKAGDKAHDNIKLLIRDRDRLQANQLVLNKQNAALLDARKWQRIWNLILTAGLGALGWTVKVLIPLALKGMAKVG